MPCRSTCPLPAEQLLDRQVIAQARLLQADQAKANGLHDGGLAPSRPTLGVGWGKFNRHPPKMARWRAQPLDSSGQRIDKAEPHAGVLLV